MNRQKILLLTLGAIIGLVVFVLVRLAWQPSQPHYHANFAVFINGQRELFKGAQYYQEVALCGTGLSPLARVHMHSNNNHVVHVHDNLVTWSDFFTNLGWTLSDSLLSDGTHVYQDGNGGHLTFMLNGRQTRSIANEIIRDRDRLLISFGNDDNAALQNQFTQVETDAAQFDANKDPAACSGSDTDDTLPSRLRRAVWF